MKILYILYDNFPYSGACTSLLNNMFFCGGLAKKTDSISVLSVNNKFISSEATECNGVCVHNLVIMSRISVSEYKKLLLTHPIRALKGMINKICSKIIPSAVDRTVSASIEREMRAINADNFDAIIAVMGHFEIAAAALEFKKKNPDTKLILYQVDPCSSNESYSESTKKEREDFERELYSVSDRIITTPILIEESKAIYAKEITDKMIAMEFPNVVPVEVGENKKTSDIRCLFAGNIYGNFRDPKYTLRLFDKTESPIKFEVIGSVKPDIKSEFELHNVIYHGPKPLKETKEALANADILVNIGNSMLNQVPSKLFEYISYGKPIVNICKNRNCPALPYLSKHKYVLNLYEEDEIFEDQVKLLNEFIADNYQNRMSVDEIENAYKKCTPQFCAEQMLEVFEKL